MDRGQVAAAAVAAVALSGDVAVQTVLPRYKLSVVKCGGWNRRRTALRGLESDQNGWQASPHCPAVS